MAQKMRHFKREGHGRLPESGQIQTLNPVTRIAKVSQWPGTQKQSVFFRISNTKAHRFNPGF